MATLLMPDGKQLKVVPKNGRNFTLDEMQAAVGGNIELLYLQDGRVLVINEDGKTMELPCNEQANPYGRDAGIADWDFIVGPALLCSDDETSD